MASDLDDAAWDRQEGLPRPEDPFVQQYLQGRDALVAQEKKQRSGACDDDDDDGDDDDDHDDDDDYNRLFRENLSPTAAEACSIVDQIRFSEQQTLWTREYEDSLAKDDADVYPGMMFSLAKERMEKSKLWQIVRRMPKGALLHCHLEAMVDLDWLLDEAFLTEGIHVTAPKPIVSTVLDYTTEFYFTYSKNTDTDHASIWTDAYTPNQPIPIAVAAASFPGTGREGFIKWVKGRCTITAEESIHHHHGPNEIWRKFTSTFPILGSLIYYEPIYRKFIRKMCQQLLDDGVQYVDMRAVFLGTYRSLKCEEPDEGFANMFSILRDEIDSFKATEEGKNFWGGRMIWTSLRIFDKRATIENMKHCIEMKKLFPELIAGFDLVGQEDLGRPLQDILPELFWFKKRCVEEGVEIPFFFHAGETLGDGDSTDENLFDAILLGTRRIGHGFSLYKHPLLIDMVKEKKILVESCPVSNEILRLTSSIMTHPLPSLLSRGVAVALSNDDPAVLGQGSNGMTHDFWQALQGWENLGLAGLGSLAENSVRWASMEDLTPKEWVQDIKDGALGQGIRAQRLKEWISQWEKYCQWIVTEYGADENFEEE